MNQLSKISVVLVVYYVFIAIDLALGVGPARFVPIDNSDVTAISADGTIVAGQSGTGATLWTEAGGIETFPLPSNYRRLDVNNLSGDGTTIVGGLSVSGFDEAFRWTREGGYQPLGRFSSDPLDYAFATDVSYDGSVVVGTNDTPNGRRAFRWTQSTGQVNLGTLGSANPSYPPFSEASSVSADGSIVVGYVSTSEDEFYKPYRWTESGGFDVIGLPPAAGNTPAGGVDQISGDGLVLAGISQWNGFDAWTWTEQTGFSILTPGPTGEVVLVFGMSFDGTTLVGGQIDYNPSFPGGFTYNAVLWQSTASGYKFSLVEDVLEAAGIDLAGWHLTGVWDVSHDGRAIIGGGTDPSGVRRSWYAVLPVPEPMSLSYVLVALPGMLVTRRRQCA